MQVYGVKDYLNRMYQIIGAAMDLYNELGYGFSEPVYQECLSIICTEKGIPWTREKDLKMYFHGKELKKFYKADFVCFDDIIVELKAVTELTSDHRAQLFNYLRITDSPAGMLINFGNPNRLISERYLYDEDTGQYQYVTRSSAY
jgi:GxxExxY protein